MREKPLATNGKTAIVPPQNLEAEESVLGAMMVSESTIEPVLLDVRLRSEDFYRDRHAVIYESVLELYSENEPVDVLTAQHRESEENALDLGAQDYLTKPVQTRSLVGRVLAVLKRVNS